MEYEKLAEIKINDITKEQVQKFDEHGREILHAIINTFAGHGIVFSNESQFQFELARELQKLFDDHAPTHKIHFEVLSFDDIKKDKKNYTDLVVEMPDGCNQSKLVAIELKYKTALPSPRTVKGTKYQVKGFEYITTNMGNGKSGIKNYVAAQGAQDNGSFDFWWDVKRLEKFIHTSDKFYSLDGSVKRAFAMIITNDVFYWKGGKTSIFNNFAMKERTVSKETIGWWYEDNPNLCQKVDRKNNWRYDEPGVYINGPCKIKWYPYSLKCENLKFVWENNKSPDGKNIPTEGYDFQYLILELENK